jgi:TonB-dependent SusC/RagA subfamily outer membrane receptor
MKVSTIENLALAITSIKDDAASAAIYGTEGANGVVIITTKQGKVGDIVVATTLNLLRNQLGPNGTNGCVSIRYLL